MTREFRLTYTVAAAFAVLFLFIDSAWCVQNHSVNISLEGPWKIHLGDDPAWAAKDYDDRSWDSVILPGSFVPYSLSHGGGYEGFVWLRKTVVIPREFQGKDMGICLGKIAHADETCVNGEKIGGEGHFPPGEYSRWNFPRFYFLPRHAVKAGETNTIAIKIWFHTYGDISGEMYLCDENTREAGTSSSLFSHVIMNYVIIAMGASLLLLFGLFYIQRPGQTEYLYYTLQLILGFFIIFDLCNLWRFPFGIEAAYKSVAFSWIAINVMHPIFLHRLYDFHRKKMEMFLMFYMTASIPLLFIVKPQEFRFYGILVSVISGSIGFYNLSCHVSALILKRPYARIFALFGITVVAGAIHDGLIYLQKLLYIPFHFLGYHFQNMIFPYTAAALYIGTALILVHRFIELLKTNEDLNVNLERKVSERTRSLILMTEELEHQNIRLEEMVIRDGLTGLYNHRAVCDRLDEMVMTSKENRFSIAVVMIDVDDFKGFNDNYGHQIGDRVLIAIADILKTHIREYDLSEKLSNKRMDDNRDYDLAGRYGGDEFVMVLPQCDFEKAVLVTERICKQVEGIRMVDYPDLRISSSFGVAVLKPDVPCLNSEKLITLADQALYKSKSLGKNRVCCEEYNNNVII